MKKRFVFIVPAFIVIVISSLLIVSNRDTNYASNACTELEEFKKEKFKGIVVRKYIDASNHRTRTVDLIKSTLPKIVLASDTSNFYNYIQREDSIVKVESEDFLYVYRANVMRKFKIYFGCPYLAQGCN